MLAGTVAADPVQRRMPSGDEVTELRLSVPEAGRRLLPLPVAAWHATVGANTVDGIRQGRRRARARASRPALLPERRGSSQPDGGGGNGDQQARDAAGSLTRRPSVRPRCAFPLLTSPAMDVGKPLGPSGSGGFTVIPDGLRSSDGDAPRDARGGPEAGVVGTTFRQATTT